METIDAKVPTGNWTLRITGDWQYGSATTDTRLVERIMEPVYEQSDYRIAFVGDLWDHITPQDKRFSWEDLDPEHPTVLSQVMAVSRIIKPAALKKRVISLGEGNHELVAAKDIGNLTKYLADNLNVPYGGYSAIVRFNKQDEALLWHGRPGISSSLPDAHSRRMAIKRRIVRTNRGRWPEYGPGRIKLFAQGHVNHLEVVSPQESLDFNMGVDWDAPGGPQLTNTYEVGDAAWYAVCGSAQRLYVKGKTSYAEARGYGPLALGCVDAHFKGGKLLDVEAIRMG